MATKVSEPISSSFDGLDLILAKVYRALSLPSLLRPPSWDPFARTGSSVSTARSPPPSEPGQHQDNKGEVLDKVYMKVVPTVCVWDRDAHETPHSNPTEEGGEGDADDIWDTIQDVESDEEEPHSRGPRRKDRKKNTAS